MSSNSKPNNPPAREAPTEAVQGARLTGCLRAIRAPSRSSRCPSRPSGPGMVGGQGAACRSRRASSPAPTPPSVRGPRRFDRPAHGVPRSFGASPAGPGRPAGPARLFEGGRAGGAFEAIGRRGACRESRAICRPCFDDKFHRGKFDEITDRADAPIEEAGRHDWCGERLTGLAPAGGGQEAWSDLWRPWIEGRGPARRALEQAGEAGFENPARLRRRRPRPCSTSLDMGDERSREGRRGGQRGQARNEEGRK